MSDALTLELQGCRDDLTVVARRQGWMLVALTVVAALLAVLAVIGTVAVVRFQARDEAIAAAVRNNNQLLCPTIRQLASTEPPRTTPAGKSSQEEFARLMRSPEYNC